MPSPTEVIDGQVDAYRDRDLDRFLSFYGRFRRHLHAVEVASGVLLIAIGLLVLTRHFSMLSGYLGFLNRFAL